MPQLTLSAPNFRRHLSSAFFYILTNYRLERRLYVKLKDWMPNSIDPDETAHWAVSSGSMLFAKAYYYRLWQWKSLEAQAQQRRGDKEQWQNRLFICNHRRTNKDELQQRNRLGTISREKLLGAGVGLQSVLLARTLKARITTTVDEILKYVAVVCCYFVFVVVFVIFFSDRIRHAISCDRSVKYYFL